MDRRAVLRERARRPILLAGGLLACLLSPAPPPAHALPGSTPAATLGADGPVYAIARSADRIYIGGAFGRVGPPAPFGAAFSAATALPRPGVPTPNGVVRAAVPDGAGGFYLGGDFTRVGGVARNRIAHITAAGVVDAFDPDVDGSVRALALSGTTLYAGGTFSTVGGATKRSRLAAFDVRTGAATTFAPAIETGSFSRVAALVVSGRTLFAGGTFWNVGGDPARGRLVALDTDTGAPTAFAAGIDGGSVDALALSGGTLYAGGTFGRAGGRVAPTGLAALDAGTGKATPFVVDPASTPPQTTTALAVVGTTLYVGGPAAARRKAVLRGYDTTTAPGTATPFAVDVDGRLQALAVAGNTLYAGGRFTSASGRANLAAFDTTMPAPAVTAFAPFVDDEVYALAATADTLYAGGKFHFAGPGSVVRHNLAVIDAATGRPLATDPDVDGPVHALRLSGATLYVGGSFDAVEGGKPRADLAAFDVATGAATAFAPIIRCRESDDYGFVRDCPGAVYALATAGDTVVAGGSFRGPRNVNGTAWRLNLAAFDGTTGGVTDFDPKVDGVVRSLAISGDTVYAGGDFGEVNQTRRRDHLAAFDLHQGAATPFDPRIDRTVRALVLSGGVLYAGGDFTAVNGTTPRSTIAAFDTSTGKATAFRPETTGPVAALALAGGVLYAGGSFTNVNGNLLRGRLAGFDTATGAATAFDPALDDTVFALDARSGGSLYAGGAFAAAGRRAVGPLVRFAERAGALAGTGPRRTAALRTASARLLPGRRGVRVSWRTGSVADVAGFLLTRTRPVGGTLRALRLTRRLIPVQGSATAYGFTDRSGRRGDRYTITTVGRDGGRRDAPTVLVTG